MTSNDPSPQLVAALERALEQDPESHDVRAHLAQLLVTTDPAAALSHAARVLQAVPGHPDALLVVEVAGAALSGDAPPPLVVPDTADELVAEWSGTDPVVEPEIGELVRPGIRLADVGGLEDVKQRLERSFLRPLRNPEVREQFGKRLRGGLLLWGPPGCGKTFVARAVAGELGAAFYAVGLADVLDMWLGRSEQNIASIFTVAREHAPCVLFFDEVDALGRKRSQLGASGGSMRGVVNQLLSEMDGIGSDNEGVFLLGATNHPWDVDAALLRPGRFDRSLLVLPPDRAAREAILATHLRGRPVGKVDLARIAKRTDGWSGADLALICEQATESAMEASLEADEVQPISQADLEEAAASVSPSIRSWMETAKNYALFSNGDGAYDELAAYLARRHR
jgi:SpoVK/Ycf46/Vps4 family AAA+-type ATPase